MLSWQKGPFTYFETDRMEGVQPFWAQMEEGIREQYHSYYRDLEIKGPREFMQSSLGHPSTVLLIARDAKSEQFAGVMFVAARKDPFIGKEDPYIYLLYTVREFRRLGLAATLIDKGEEILRRRGQKSLSAPAGHNDDAIISLGERRGYLREIEFMSKQLES